uniref:Seven TM Receptor n=1 Tax=Caenorhabditis tropicalis TaxID=1561998 RepID=A0A1I7TC96_9PELO
MLCGFIAVTVNGIAIHFVYRQGRLRYFNSQFLIIWFSIPLLAGTIWFFVTRFAFPMNKPTTEYIRSTVKQYFNLNIDDCVYGAAVFYPLDENGKKFISWRSFIGLSCYLTLLTIPFLIILVCGAKSWRKVKRLLEHGESEFARNLQMQLYRALIVQTIIPILFFFIPFGVLFILPVFEINVQFLSGPVTVVLAVYPAIDSLPTLLCVDYYRIAIFNYFKYCRCKNTRIEGTGDESVSRAYQTTN